MTSPVPKVLLEVAGKPVLWWSVRAFETVPDVDSIVVAAHPDSIPEVARLMEGHAKVEAIVPGGSTRSASTRAALDVIPAADGIVLIHDGARPAVSPALVAELIAAMDDADAATVAVPARDTILEVADGAVSAVPSRATLWQAQTPQAFRLSVIRQAHAAAERDNADFTDDCGVVLEYLPQVPIRVVEGSSENIKVTSPGDVERAARILAQRSG